MVTETVLRRLGICFRTVGEPTSVVELVSEYYRRCLNMDIPEGDLASLAQGLNCQGKRTPRTPHAPGDPNDTRAHQHSSATSLSPDSEAQTADVVGGARSLLTPGGTCGDGMVHSTSASGAGKMHLSLVIGDPTDSRGFAKEAATESERGWAGSTPMEPVKCDAMLVDLNAFGKDTGLELGKFVQSHKPGDTRYTSKSKVGEEKERAKHFPPLILLACKAEEQDHELGRMGFAIRMFKPLKISELVDSLANITATDWHKPVLSRTSTLEKLSARKALADLLRGRRFLVVDDNMVNRLVAKRMLERYGSAVVAVDGGQSAINKLRVSCDFDTVFMDIQMPEMDGFEATERIRALEARGELGEQSEVSPASTQKEFTRLKIVALTADVFGANRSKCEDSGMDGYITKPLEEEQFYKTMVYILGPDSSNSTPKSGRLNPFDSTPTSNIAKVPK